MHLPLLHVRRARQRSIRRRCEGESMEWLDDEILSNAEIEKIRKEEENYRISNGYTCPPDENVCKFCRHIDKKNPFCWDCNLGSRYETITFPLFNICLTITSLTYIIEEYKSIPDFDQNNILRKIGFLEALKTVIQPFELTAAIKKYEKEINNNNFLIPDEIENVKVKNKFKQSKITAEEIEYENKHGIFLPKKNVCEHCKFNSKFGTIFCWECLAGTKFKNGIRSIEIIKKLFHYLNTESGESLEKGEHNSNLKIIRLGFAEGLKWVIKPYITDESIIYEDGYEYIGADEMDFFLEQEIEEYRILESL